MRRRRRRRMRRRRGRRMMGEEEDERGKYEYLELLDSRTLQQPPFNTDYAGGEQRDRRTVRGADGGTGASVPQAREVGASVPQAREVGASAPTTSRRRSPSQMVGFNGPRSRVDSGDSG